MKIQGVLFDKDGTLIEVNATWVPIYREILKELCATDEAGAEALMQRAGYDPARGKFAAGSLLKGEAFEARVHHMDHGYTHLVRDKLTPLMPLEPLLVELRGMGLKLGVATNDSHVSAKAHMAHVGVIEHFDDIIAADTVAVPKPSGNMIAKFADITGLPAASLAMVGDNHHDMEEARAGGAGLAIAVLSGNAAREDIAHLADYTIESVADLPALLRSL
jgi:phosphoglycolate phosphatase